MKHEYLWGVIQTCVDTIHCTSFSGDKEAIICAEGPKDERDSACKGDSGGTFITEDYI